MIERKTLETLKKRLKDYPAVALLGPRQIGKTTLAKILSSNYYDLEQPQDQSTLDFEWPEIKNKKQLIVFDEAQAYPPIFPRLRGEIDAQRKRNGRFLILGSISPALMKEVSESLAGRLSLVNLPSLNILELPQVQQWKELWLYGGFPDGGILKSKHFPQWQNDYLQLLVTRDFPKWGLPAKPMVTERLFHMLAATHGQSWNASSIGKSLGLSHHTVNDYLDFLEGAFLIRKLYPFSANIKKRLVKSPKVYWRDSGLLHALLNVNNYQNLLRQAWVGASWEGFIVEQILNALELMGIHTNNYYFRTHDGQEIDLLLEFASNDIWGIEIKLSSSINSSDIVKLKSYANTLGLKKYFIIGQIEKPILSDLGGICSIQTFLSSVLKGVGS